MRARMGSGGWEPHLPSAGGGHPLERGPRVRGAMGAWQPSGLSPDRVLPFRRVQDGTRPARPRWDARRSPSVPADFLLRQA